MTLELPIGLQVVWNTPIELLKLTSETCRLLKWDGITNIGECTVFYYHHTHEPNLSDTLFFVMYGEVAQQLRR